MATVEHTPADPSDGPGTSVRPPRKRRRRKRIWASVVVLCLVAAGVLTARSQQVRDAIVRRIRAEVSSRLGLDIQMHNVRFSWRRFAILADEVELRHPTEGLLARVDTLEIAPAFASFFRSNVVITRLVIDGGRLDLRFRGGRLVNGPTLRGPPPPRSARIELPFQDLAISDVHVHVEHDELGALDLPAVDLDVHNDRESHRILIGALSQRGEILRARCFSGALGRAELRGAVTVDGRTATIALARVEGQHIFARVRDVVVPLDLRGFAEANVELSGALATLTCPVPGGPPLHGDVSLSAHARVELRQIPQAHGPPRMDLASVALEGHMHGERISFDLPKPDRIFHFGGPDEIDVDFHADRNAVQVDRLHGRYAGGTVVSPGRHPERPLRVRFGPEHVSVEGYARVDGLNFTDLMRETTVTDFTKVLWTISADMELRGDLDRFASPHPDPRHPALAFDIDAETRDFAVLREFWNRPPQRPVIAISRGRVRGAMVIDADYIRFRDIRLDLAHSRADIALIQMHLAPDQRTPDFVLEGARAENLRLEDIGMIADIPIAGSVSFRVDARGPYIDPILIGDARLREFQFHGLPLGDFETTTPWRYRDLRVDYPALTGHAGHSTFAVRDGFLDFRRYSLHAGARVASDSLVLADLYHMLELEGDPVFEPFTGRTMPRCSGPRSTAVDSRHASHHTTCVDPSARIDDPRRPIVPTGTSTGHASATLDYWLGRPGDDRDGVLDVDIAGRDLALSAYGETVTHVDTHLGFRWLVRSRGYRGSRVNIEYARGQIGSGSVELSGQTDLGGVLHLVGRATNVDLAQLHGLDDTGVRGMFSGIATIDGMPDAMRIAANGSVRNLIAMQRSMGEVTLDVNSAPEGPHSNDPHARPPRNRWDVQLTGLGGVLAARGSLSVPWRAISWRDVDGVSHPDWERDWPHTVLRGRAELTRTLDLLPLLPNSTVATLGRGAIANVRGRVDVERAVLGDYRHAEARVVIDELTAGTTDLRFGVARGNTLAACLNDGIYWVEPAATRGPDACAVVPARMRSRGSLAASLPELAETEIVGPQGTRIRVSGGGAVSGRLELGLRGDIDLARMASLVPGITWARGVGHFQIGLGGDTTNPRLAGTLALDGAAVGASVLPDPVQDIHLLVRFNQQRVELERARAQFGASAIDMTGGYLAIRGREIEHVEVPITVRNLSIVPQSGVEVALDADTHLVWEPGDRTPLLRGDLTLLRVRYTRPINLIQDPSGDVRTSSSDSREEPYDPDRDHVQLDLRVHAREPARVSNNLLDAEVRLEENERPFRITGTDQRVGALGVLSVPRGRVFFRNNDFDVRRGRIEFTSADRIRPEFDVLAQTEIRRGSSLADAYRNQWRINLHAYGSPDRVQLDMTSDPQLAREDILLLLTFGMIRAELDQITATGNVGAAGQGLAVEALATATGLDRTVGRTLQTIQGGLPVQLVDEFRVGSAYSPTQGRTVPQVTVGRRLLNDRIRIGATVATTERREIRVTADARIDDAGRASVQLNYDNVNAQGSDAIGNIGVDLRYRLDFSGDGSGR